MSNSCDKLWFTGVFFEDLNLSVKYMSHPVMCDDEATGWTINMEDLEFTYEDVKNHCEIPFRVFDFHRRVIWYYFLNEEIATIFSQGLRAGLSIADNPYKFWHMVLDQAIQKEIEKDEPI